MFDLEPLVDFFITSNKLKSTMRYESCSDKIQDSTAGHCWQVAFMVPIIARELNLSIDVLHAMEIASVHDLPEYIDQKDYDSYFVFIGKLNKSDKDKSEEAVMSDLKNRFHFGHIIYSLWKEYTECKTPEARFVKALDKIESHFHIIQRGGLVREDNHLVYQITYADNAVRNFPQLEPLLKAAKDKLRILIESQGLVWKDEYNYPN